MTLRASRTSAGDLLGATPLYGGSITLDEMGHVLGPDSSFAGVDREGLMYAYLTTGERRLPMRIKVLK